VPGPALRAAGEILNCAAGDPYRRPVGPLAVIWAAGGTVSAGVERFLLICAARSTVDGCHSSSGLPGAQMTVRRGQVVVTARSTTGLAGRGW
jgi:hypothetical protein